MNATPLLSGLAGAGLLVLILWVSIWIPAIILRKAGFPGWYVLPLLLMFPVGWIIFAMAQWPVHRELAWLRMRAGKPAEHDVDLVERYAVDLEQCGEWKAAIEVYEELARRSRTKEGPDYYRNCARMIRDRQEEAGVA